MNQRSIFLTVTFVALLVIGGAFWMMQKRQAVSQPVVTVPVVETSAQAEPEKYPQHIEVIPDNTDEVWYNIPEYGVRMKLNSEFADDLIYRFVHEKNTKGEEWDTVYLTTKSLLDVDAGCSDALGAMGRSEGRDGSEKNQLGYYESEYFGQVIFQLSQQFIYWQGPQSICWDQENEEEVRKTFPKQYDGLGVKNVREGMRTIELIP